MYWEGRKRALEELYLWQEWENVANEGTNVHLKWIPKESKQIIEFAESYATVVREREMMEGAVKATVKEKSVDVQDRPPEITQSVPTDKEVK